MIYNDKYIITVDNIQPELKTISIAIDHVIVDENDNIISKIDRNRRAFIPGDTAGVLDYIEQQAPSNNYEDVVNILNIMWTQDVVDNYNNSLLSNE